MKSKSDRKVDNHIKNKKNPNCTVFIIELNPRMGIMMAIINKMAQLNGI